MQSASLYNYASITCSMCVLISHLKSMTCIYQASLSSDPGSLPMQVPLTVLFITDFKGSTDARSAFPLWDARCKNQLAAGGNTNVYTRARTLHTSGVALSVDWPRLSSRMWEWRLQEAGQPHSAWSHPAVRPLANSKSSFIEGKLCHLMEAGRIGSDTA